MPRSKAIPNNADLYRRLVSDLDSVHHVDLVNGGHKKLGVSPERYAELVGTLVYGAAYTRFLAVVSEFLREGDNSELGRLAGLVLPAHNSPDQSELFPPEAEDSSSPKRRSAASA